MSSFAFFLWNGPALDPRWSELLENWFQEKDAIHANDELSYEHALQTAVDSPIHFPPLSQAIFPGDSVAIAVAADIPSPILWLQSLLRYLLSNAVSTADIRVVLAQGLGGLQEEIQHALQRFQIAAEHVTTHDPGLADRLEYLAADETAEPIYVDRDLMESDVVIPIVPIRAAKSPNSFGLSGMVPEFLDSASQRRFRERVLKPPRDLAQAASIEYAQHIGTLVGIPFSLCVGADEPGTAPQAIAGDPMVITRSLASHEANSPAPANVELLIVELSPTVAEPIWAQIGRAVAELEGQVENGGRIVVMTRELSPPRGALKILGALDDDERQEQKIKKSELPFAMTAAILLEAKNRIHVTICCPNSKVELEEIGLGSIHSLPQFQRMAASCQRIAWCKNPGYASAAILQAFFERSEA